ncbi:MAG: radical SAM protein [Deltaproteobacteria bacterium]|nr:radical SAM protein [Deltaproteobacteria bacterium]
MTALSPGRCRINTASPCIHPWPTLICPVCGPLREASAGDALQPGNQQACGEAQAVLAAVRAGLAAGHRHFDLLGGELLLRPEALDLLTQARRDGAQGLAVWTSGTLLARPQAAARIRQAGATQVVVGLFGDSPAAHDYVAGTDGHFQRVLAGLRAARAAKLGVWVAAPLLRPTFRGLPGLVQKTLPAGIAGVHLWAPPGPDRSSQPLLAPLAIMAPWLQAALTILATAKRPWRIDGVPACLLGEWAQLQPEWPLWRAMEPLAAEPETAGDANEFAATCADCTWRSSCVGVPAARARGHGWLGLQPRTDAPKAAQQELS